MAVPRVFVSSTYYDLKPVRDNIRSFINGLGYEPIMHEKSEVTYTQSQPLERDCYNAVGGADIVICIIGNRFGTPSAEGALSITMTEITTAIKRKKKVYIFIARDIYAENKTYERNKDFDTFKSAYTDDLEIHKFISQLNSDVKTHPIFPFDSVEEIISILKTQFAGLFQYLLAQEASMTEEKTATDLQHSADQMKEVVREIEQQQKDFWGKFDSTLLSNNLTLTKIKSHLGLVKSAFFATDIESLTEILNLAGFDLIKEESSEREFCFKRVLEADNTRKIQSLTLRSGLFDDELKLIPLRNMATVDANLNFAKKEEDITEDLPF